MKAVPHSAVFVLALAAASLLAACASPQEPKAAETATAVAATPQADAPAEITGSRLPTRRTEKMVSQIGGKDYNENKTALPAPLRSN